MPLHSPFEPPLTRREREILEVLFRRGRASAGDVLGDLQDPPSYSAVRALLARLEQKGHVRHDEEGRTYVYSPVLRKDAVRHRALVHLVRTFFDNSTEKAMAALLALRDRPMSDHEMDEIAAMAEQAKREGR